MSFLPIFQLPSQSSAPSYSLNPFNGTGFITHDVILPVGMAPQVEFSAFAPSFTPSFTPSFAPAPRPISWVGALIIQRTPTGDAYILPRSNRRKGYDILGGHVPHGDPRDSINALVHVFGLHVDPSTRYVDIPNSNGRVSRVYVLYASNFSCTVQTCCIQGNPVIRVAYSHFARFNARDIASGRAITDSGAWTEVVPFVFTVVRAL